MPFLEENLPGMSPPHWAGLDGALTVCVLADAAAYTPFMSEAMEVGPQASRAWPLTTAHLVAIPALPACFPCQTRTAEEGRALPPPQLVPCAQAASLAAPTAAPVGPAGEGLRWGKATREGKICTTTNTPASAI